jgi:hypothetical protein
MKKMYRTTRDVIAVSITTLIFLILIALKVYLPYGILITWVASIIFLIFVNVIEEIIRDLRNERESLKEIHRYISMVDDD